MFSRQPDITVAPFICRRVTQRTYDWASKLRAIISLFDTACGYEEMLVAPAPALSSARDPCIELWSVRGFANAAPSTPLGRELGMPSRLSKSSFQVPECSSPLRILARTATSQHSSAYPLTVFQTNSKREKNLQLSLLLVNSECNGPRYSGQRPSLHLQPVSLRPQGIWEILRRN